MNTAGHVSDEAKKLCDVTKLALDEAIKVCREGVPYREIGSIINGIADQHKFGVIKDYVGHGVGKQFHSAPSIQDFRNNGSGTMKLWQTFTIEPMLVQVCHIGVTDKSLTIYIVDEILIEDIMRNNNQ
jgi:methionyl aminopeptidase